jgi:hypothetical protein
MKPPTPLLEVVSAGADTDPEIERLLHAARESAEPLPENRERVSRALGSALPVSLAALSPAAMTPAAVSSTAIGATLPAGSGLPAAGAVGPAGLGGASGAWLRSGGLLVGGLLLGGLGFWLGHDLGYSKGTAQGLREQLGQGAARELAAAHAPDVAARQPAAPLAPSPSRGLVSVPAPLEAERGEPAAALALGPRKQPRTAAANGARRAAHGAEPATPVESPSVARLTFRQVLEQLRRAQQQLRAGQAAMSLLVLSELDRGAGDLLLEERETTRVLALCAVGQDKDARAAARSLEQKNPGSIYSMRLSTSCAGAEVDVEDGAIDDLTDQSLGSALPE